MVDEGMVGGDVGMSRTVVGGHVVGVGLHM